MPYFNVGGNFQLGFVPHYPITRTILAPRLASPLGGGVSQLRRRYPRPLSQFTLRDTQATKAESDALFGFFNYMQGDIPFFWSGGEWGTVSTPALVGFGDGVRTQFLLPNRYITGNLMVYLNGVLVEPTPAVDGATGLITTATALAGQLDATYTTIYKVSVWTEAESLLAENNVALGLFTREGLILREFVP